MTRRCDPPPEARTDHLARTAVPLAVQAAQILLARAIVPWIVTFQPRLQKIHQLPVPAAHVESRARRQPRKDRPDGARLHVEQVLPAGPAKAAHGRRSRCPGFQPRAALPSASAAAPGFEKPHAPLQVPNRNTLSVSHPTIVPAVTGSVPGH
jgi:hypothetical protein